MIRIRNSNGLRARNKMICFPYAGGCASFYGKWKEKMESIEICPVQLPGREEAFRDEKIYDMDTASDQIVETLKDYVDQDTVFFGHSMGAFVMYETMLILQKLLNRKAYLAISSGQVSPFGYGGVGFDASSEEAVINYIKDMGGTDDILISNAEARSFFIPIIQNDLMAASSYSATRMTQSDKCQSIAVVYGEDDEDITDDNIKDWTKIGENFIGNHIFKGGHFYMNTFGDELLRYIDKVSGKQSA